MFIPRGEKGKPANRFPFLTYAIIVLAVLHYALLHADTSAVLSEFHGALAEILDTAAADEKLMLDSRLAVYITDQMDEAAASALDARFEDVLEEPQGTTNEFTSERRPGHRSLKQAKLDQMTDEALELLLEHPGYAKGYGSEGYDAPRLLTHLFTYFYLPTLIGSILILALVGGFVEAIWGRLFWLVCFFGGGILNALVYLQTGSPSELLFGFSGGVMALLGAFTVRYTLKWVYFSLLIFSAALPGFLIVLAALAWDIALPTVESFGAPPFHVVTTPYVAHAVVFGFGVLLGVLVRVLKLESKINPFDESEESVEINSIVQNALHAKKSGKIDHAYTLLQTESRKRPNNVELLLAFWDVAVANQKSDQAAPRMLQLIRDRLRANAASEAIEYWKVVATGHPEVSADPKLLAQLALLLGKDNREIAGFTLRRFFDKPGDDLTPRLAARLCRLAREIDCVIPVDVAALALRGNDPEADDRAYLENLVAAARGVAKSAPTVGLEDIVGSRAIEIDDLATMESSSTPKSVGVLDETALREPLQVDDLLGTFEKVAPPPKAATSGVAGVMGFSAEDLKGLDSGVNLDEVVLPDLPDFDAPSLESAADRLPEMDAPAAPTMSLEGSLFDDETSAAPASPKSDTQQGVRTPLAPMPADAVSDLSAFDPSDVGFDALQAEATSESPAAGSFSVEDFDASALDASQLLDEVTGSGVGFDPSLGVENVDTTALDPSALSAEIGSAARGELPTEPGLFDPSAISTESVPGEDSEAGLEATDMESAVVAPPAPRPVVAAAAVSPAPSQPAVAATGAAFDANLDDVDLSGLFDEASGMKSLRALAVQECVPLAVETSAMLLRTIDGEKQRISVSQVQAVTFAAVRGLSEKPVVLIDLVLNWQAAKSEPLQVIRLRSDRFNPRLLRPQENSPLNALRRVVADLVQNAPAQPLPGDAILAATTPKIFASLDEYQEEVLGAR